MPRSLVALRSLLEVATTSGEAQLLVCWLGDEKKAATSLSITPAGAESLDFGSVWEQPLLLSVQRDCRRMSPRTSAKSERHG